MVPVAVPCALGNRRVWRRAAQRDHDRLVTFGLVVSLHHDGDGFRRFVRREGQGARGDGGVVGAGRRRARARIRVGHRRLHAGSPALGHLECQLARGPSGPLGNTRPADRQCGWIIVVLDGDHRLAGLDCHAPSRLLITQLDLDRLIQLVVGVVHHRYRDGLRSFACCEGQRLRNTRVVGAGGRRAPGDHFHRHLLVVDRWIQGNRKDQRLTLINACRSRLNRKPGCVVVDDGARSCALALGNGCLRRRTASALITTVSSLSDSSSPRHRHGNGLRRFTGREGQGQRSRYDGGEVGARPSPCPCRCIRVGDRHHAGRWLRCLATVNVSGVVPLLPSVASPPLIDNVGAASSSVTVTVTIAAAAVASSAGQCS